MGSTGENEKALVSLFNAPARNADKGVEKAVGLFVVLDGDTSCEEGLAFDCEALE